MEQYSPLSLLNHPFDSELVSGITQSEKGNYLDFVIDRPNGMDGYLLQLTTFGMGYIFDGKQSLVTYPGQLLLFSPKAVQHYYRHPDSQFWHYKWIYFYPNSIWNKWLNWVNSEQYIGRIFIKDHVHFQQISQVFSKIEQELKTNGGFHSELARHLLEYLLVKCASMEQFSIENETDSRIISICEIITHNLAKNFSIEELAQQVFLSPSRLSHLFKDSLGMSLVQWREQQRISEAKKLLYFSDIPINSLAKSLGYDDPFYFSKIFRKHTNLSPSQFRSIERYKI
ncbi:arabinose operon transcriptional regulator AraC [Ursidibacter arcticus]